MASSKTETTELAVACGLLGIPPEKIPEIGLESCFDETLTYDKFSDFVEEYFRDEKFYQQFLGVGFSTRDLHPILSKAKPTVVRWEGQYQQASTVSTPKDLVASGIAISVKAKSHVVNNLSPHTLFISIPTGAASFTRSDNWFRTVAGAEYQHLYTLVRQAVGGNYPGNVDEFHHCCSRSERKSFSTASVPLFKLKGTEISEAYLDMCRQVSVESVRLFVDGLNTSQSGAMRQSVAESILRNFLRLGESPYVLCGLDGKNRFALSMPDLTTWKRDWVFGNIRVEPDQAAGQSKVAIALEIVKRHGSRSRFTLNYHVEIRWSHGRFVTNPEAKLYKEFDWVEMPFVEKIQFSSRVQKLYCIGSGGFGSVYRGYTQDKLMRSVAIKEFSPKGELSASDFDQMQSRFAREVGLQAQLKHPNILPVLGHDLAGPTSWFYSPLAICSVNDILSELSRDPLRLLKMFGQVIDAVEYAHGQTVIHRDIKPANILVFEDDRVMLSDFGLGKRFDSSDVPTLTKTAAGSIRSFPYAAPEQESDLKSADYRTDIFALGITLAAMAMGREPDSREDALAGVDEMYIGFIQRCCETNPEERFQSLDEVRAAFQELSVSVTNLSY